MKFFIFTALLLSPLAALHSAEPPHILLREALQYENIGDSGRVPGTIRLLYQHLPGATVTLWPWQLHEREREMLTRAFPKLHPRHPGPIREMGAGGQERNFLSVAPPPSRSDP